MHGMLTRNYLLCTNSSSGSLLSITTICYHLPFPQFSERKACLHVPLLPPYWPLPYPSPFSPPSSPSSAQLLEIMPPSAGRTVVPPAWISGQPPLQSPISRGDHMFRLVPFYQVASCSPTVFSSTLLDRGLHRGGIMVT